MNRRALAMLALCLAPLAAREARAGAFYIPERGARALAMGGAFIAGVDDLNAQWLNPAALVRLHHDLSLYLDLGVIFSDQSFLREDDAEVMRKDPTYADGFPTVHDVGAPFPDPSLGVASDFGLDDFVFALGVYGPYAGTNEWPEDGPQRYSLVNLAAVEIFAQASVAWRPSEYFAVGLGLQGVITQLKQRLVISAYPGVFGWPEERDLETLAEVNVTDGFEPSADFGVLVSPTHFLDIGLSAQLPVSADAHGKIQVNKPTHYYFSNSDVVGDQIGVGLDFPWILRGGIRVHDEELWSAELAAVYEMWSTLDGIPVTPGKGGIAFTNVPGIGTYHVKPFTIEQDYKDVISLRAGGSFSPGAGMFTLRGGFYYETAAAPNQTLTVLDIDGDKIGITLGGTVRLGKFQLDLSAAYVKTFQRAVPNSIKTQVNPIYTADPTPYDETGPDTVGNGTYNRTNFILASTFSAGF